MVVVDDLGLQMVKKGSMLENVLTWFIGSLPPDALDEFIFVACYIKGVLYTYMLSASLTYFISHVYDPCTLYNQK